MTLRRARIVLVCAVVVSLVIALRSLPSGNPISARHSVQAVANQLARVHKQEAALRQEEKNLGTSQEVERLAHQQYGLVAPGQKEYVILPAGRSAPTGGSGGSTGAGP